MISQENKFSSWQLFTLFFSPNLIRPWQTRTHCCRQIVADTNVSSFASQMMAKKASEISFRAYLHRTVQHSVDQLLFTKRLIKPRDDKIEICLKLKTFTKLIVVYPLPMVLSTSTDVWWTCTHRFKTVRNTNSYPEKHHNTVRGFCTGLARYKSLIRALYNTGSRQVDVTSRA